MLRVTLGLAYNSDTDGSWMEVEYYFKILRVNLQTPPRSNKGSYVGVGLRLVIICFNSDC